MSDIKKYAIAANAAAAVLPLPCVIFLCTAGALFRGAVCCALLFAALCAGVCAAAASGQRAEKRRTQLVYSAVCAGAYLICACALTVGSGTLAKRLPENAAGRLPGITAAVFTFVFVTALYAGWRKAYKKTMNRKPFPGFSVLAAVLIAAAAVLPERMLVQSDPQNDLPDLPSPVAQEYLSVSPETDEDTIHFYISPDAPEGGSGLTEAEPLRELSAARERIRFLSGTDNDIAVHFMPGKYAEEEFSFTAADSGTEEREMIFLAEKGVGSVSGSLKLSVSKNAEHITLSGFSLLQNDTAEVNGNYITVCGCGFTGCALTVSGSNNRIVNNVFSMTNGAAVTDRGIADKILYNSFCGVNAMTDGVLALYGTDSDAEGNCFSGVTLHRGTACVFLADEACGITFNGNMLLNVPGNSVSYRENGKGDAFRAFSGNYLLNASAPVVNDRTGGTVSVKCCGNIILTGENAEKYPLNAVYPVSDAEKIFTDPYGGEYSLIQDSPVRTAFPSLKEIDLPYFAELPEKATAAENASLPESASAEATVPSEEETASEEIVFG